MRYRVYFVRNPLRDLDRCFLDIQLGWHDLASEGQQKVFLEADIKDPEIFRVWQKVLLPAGFHRLAEAANEFYGTIPVPVTGYHKTEAEAVASVQKWLRKTRKRCTQILNSIVTDRYLDVAEAQEWAAKNRWDWSTRPGSDWPTRFIRNEKISVIWWDNGWACSVSPTGVFDNASFGSAIAAMKMADKMFPRDKD